MYQSLCVMPLKLLERVLPWFVVKLNEAEAVSFLQNMRLAGSLCYVPTSLLNNTTA
jgi:zinc finger-like protein